MGQKQPRVVIIGGGFGGLRAAKALAKAPVEVVLVDRNNYHLFQPLLYQVASAGLSPADISAPIRAVLHRQKNTRVLLGNVTKIDRQARTLQVEEREVDYDYLIVAAGMRNNYFGNNEWATHATGLKSVEEALEIRRRMLLAFEQAEYCKDPEERERLLTFVVAGGGPTGVEMAGAIAEIAKEIMASDFRNLDPSDTRIVLIEGQDRLLAAFAESSSSNAREQLEARGVTVRTSTFVEAIDENGVVAGGERIQSKTVIWAAGMKGSPLAEALDTELARAGRAIVNQTLNLPDDERVFVIGDLAHFKDPKKGVLPGLAPVAMQQGTQAGKNIRRVLGGKQAKPFSYTDKGMMATIGRASAVAERGPFRLRGFLAWVAWLFVHLVFLVGFRSKAAVLMNWAYAYLAFRRSTRLIVGPTDINSPDEARRLRASGATQ